MDGRLSSVYVDVNGIGGGNDVNMPGNESRPAGSVDEDDVEADVVDAVSASGNSGLSSSRDSRIYICAHR